MIIVCDLYLEMFLLVSNIVVFFSFNDDGDDFSTLQYFAVR